MSNLHFDQHQFSGVHRRSHPVEAQYSSEGWSSNGIAYEDYERMSSRSSSVPLRHRRWTPAFAASDEKLRRVLLCRGWLYLHGMAKLDISPADWKTVNTAATKKAMQVFTTAFTKCPAHKRCESAAHIAAVKRAGGYLELQAALAYHAWRLGQDSVAIGETLGMSPQAVRVNLQRLCEVARKLDYETFRRHYSFGRVRPKRNLPVATTPKNINTGFIIDLYKEGKNVSQIAQAIGYAKNHGNNRVRRILDQAGFCRKTRQRGQHVN